MRFKLSFTKSDGFDYYVGSKVRQNDIYNQLVKLTDSEQSSYFPKYRGN